MFGIQWPQKARRAAAYKSHEYTTRKKTSSICTLEINNKQVLSFNYNGILIQEEGSYGKELEIRMMCCPKSPFSKFHIVTRKPILKIETKICKLSCYIHHG